MSDTRPRWLAESTALRRLGIETQCCESCLSEEQDTGEMPHEVEGNGRYVECCCQHYNEIQKALRDGRLS